MNKIQKVLIIGIPIIILLATGYWFIAPNYKNKITTEQPDTTNNQSVAVGNFSSLRMERDIAVYARESTAIVVGTFTSKSRGEWNDDRSWIYTPVEFKVDEVLKGEVVPGNEIIIKQYGGEVDGEITRFDDEFVYVEGQRNLLFLGTNENDDFVVLAGDWGQFIINEENTVENFSDETVGLSDFKSEISKRIE